MIRILLSKRLGEIRMTQADLARKTGIRANTINDLYHELTDRISLTQIEQICEVVGCEFSDLIVQVPDNAQKPIKGKQGSLTSSGK